MSPYEGASLCLMSHSTGSKTAVECRIPSDFLADRHMSPHGRVSLSLVSHSTGSKTSVECRISSDFLAVRHTSPYGRGSLCLIIVAFYWQQNIRGMPNIQWFPCSSAHVSAWKRVIMSHNCRILQEAKHPWNAEYPVISLQLDICLRMKEGHYVSCRILQAAKQPWNAEYRVISLQFGTCLAWKSVTKSRVAFYRQQNIRGMPNTQWFPCSSAHVFAWKSVTKSRVAFYRQQNIRGMPNIQWFPCSSAHVSAWKRVIMFHVAF